MSSARFWNDTDQPDGLGSRGAPLVPLTYDADCVDAPQLAHRDVTVMLRHIMNIDNLLCSSVSPSEPSGGEAVQLE